MRFHLIHSKNMNRAYIRCLTIILIHVIFVAFSMCPVTKCDDLGDDYLEKDVNVSNKTTRISSVDRNIHKNPKITDPISPDIQEHSFINKTSTEFESNNQPQSSDAETTTLSSTSTTLEENATEKSPSRTRNNKVIDELCIMVDFSIEVSDINILTVNWNLSSSGQMVETCNTYPVSFHLTKTSCDPLLETECEIELLEVARLSDLTHTFEKELLDPCEEKYDIKITISYSLSENITNEGHLSSKTQYGKVNLNVSQPDPEDVNTTIKWTYENSSSTCQNQITFEIRVQTIRNPESFIKEAANIADYERTFTDLEPCEAYYFTVFPSKSNAAIHGDNVTYTLHWLIPSSVRDLTSEYKPLDTNGPMVSVFWSPPQFAPKCVSNYTIQIITEPEEGLHNTVTRSNTYIDIGNVFACINYTISVYVNNKAGVPAASENTSVEIPARPYEKTNLDIIEITSTSVTLNATIEDQYNRCPTDEYIFYLKNLTQDDSEDFIEFRENTIPDLEPFTNYSSYVELVVVGGEKSPPSEEKYFRTMEGVPSIPEINTNITSTNYSCEIMWSPPMKPNGIIKSYTVRVEFDSLNYEVPDDCDNERPPPFRFYEPFLKPEKSENSELVIEMNFSENESSYTFDNLLSSSKYSFNIKVTNGAESSDYSSSVVCETEPGIPEQVRNFKIERESEENGREYNSTSVMSWKQPCVANGKIERFNIQIQAVNSTSDEYVIEEPFDNVNKIYVFDTEKFAPDQYYNVDIWASNGNIRGQVYKLSNHFSEGGYPKLISPEKIRSDQSTHKIKLSIPKEIFNSLYGDIQKISVFIEQDDDECPATNDVNIMQGRKENEGKHIFWIEANSNGNCVKKFNALEIPRVRMYDDSSRAKDTEENFDIVLGTESCSQNILCNGPLRPGKYFQISLRLYTEKLYSDLILQRIKTDSETPIVLIVTIIVSAIVSVFIVGFWISYRKTMRLRKEMFDENSFKDIPSIDFARYYNVMRENNEAKIKEEYLAINAFSESLEKTCIASRASQKLNRYSNISPFDENRVVLDADEFENDYINASFVDGYNAHREYIAAQGPLPTTAHDFWRMIYQYRVEQIVMLTALVEGNRIKCHEYFPKFRGSITYANMKITCIDEIDRENYTKRNLQININDVIRYVDHFSYKSWPDHGVPQGSEPLIEFCRMLRKERKQLDGTIVVHCSAGVGRTGTLIAIDIIIQRLKQEKKINIFDLVKQLRTQRVSMVQTGQQYVFLYKTAMDLVNGDMNKQKWKVINYFAKLLDDQKPKKFPNQNIQLNAVLDNNVPEIASDSYPTPESTESKNGK